MSIFVNNSEFWHPKLLPSDVGMNFHFGSTYIFIVNESFLFFFYKEFKQAQWASFVLKESPVKLGRYQDLLFSCLASNPVSRSHREHPKGPCQVQMLCDFRT